MGGRGAACQSSCPPCAPLPACTQSGLLECLQGSDHLALESALESCWVLLSLQGQTVLPPVTTSSNLKSKMPG